jgi:hypothetical protein
MSSRGGSRSITVNADRRASSDPSAARPPARALYACMSLRLPSKRWLERRRAPRREALHLMVQMQGASLVNGVFGNRCSEGGRGTGSKAAERPAVTGSWTGGRVMSGNLAALEEAHGFDSRALATICRGSRKLRHSDSVETGRAVFAAARQAPRVRGCTTATPQAHSPELQSEFARRSAITACGRADESSTRGQRRTARAASS